MNKRYKLLKDLPDAKAGSEFVYDGIANYDFNCKDGKKAWFGKEAVENNPEWFEEIKQPEERITVSHLWQHDSLASQGSNYWYQFCTNRPFQMLSSKAEEKIEAALNDDAGELPKWAQDLGVRFDGEEYTSVHGEPSKDFNKIMQEIADAIVKNAPKLLDAGEGFVWTDELVREMLVDIFSSSNLTTSNHGDVASNLINAFKGKQSKQQPSSYPKNIQRDYDSHSPSNTSTNEGRDWEIVAYKCFYGDKEFTYYLREGLKNLFEEKRPSGLNSGHTISRRSLENDQYAKIHSVKRLDKIGEQPVFTVGEDVNFDNGQHAGIIKQMFIDADGYLSIDVGLPFDTRINQIQKLSPSSINDKYDPDPIICKNCGFHSEAHLAPDFKCPTPSEKVEVKAIFVQTTKFGHQVPVQIDKYKLIVEAVEKILNQ